MKDLIYIWKVMNEKGLIPEPLNFYSFESNGGFYRGSEEYTMENAICAFLENNNYCTAYKDQF